MKRKPTYKELEARLRQAEETLRAIRSGEIDAIVGERWPLIIKAKELEDKLRESQETLELAISGSNAGIWDLRFNPEDPYKIPDEIYISPRLKGFIGFGEDEFPNSISAWHSRIHPEDLELVRKVAQEHLEGKREIYEVEYRIYHKDGGIRWIYSRGKILRDENGVPKRWTGVDWDITERKKKEEELRAREDVLKFERDQLLSLFDSINQVIYVTDPISYEVLFVNRYLRELLGRDPVGGFCYKEFQGLDHPCEFCTNDIILKLKGEPYRWEYHNPFLNRDYEITDRIIKWPDGREVRFEIAIDITERKHYEGMLRNSEERFRNIAEAASEYIWETDAKGRYCYVTQKMEAILGRPINDILGHKPFDFMPPDEAKRMRKLISEFVERKQPFRDVEHKAFRPDGTILWEQVSGVPIFDEEGNIAAYRGTASDITERKRIEEELRESERRFKDLFDYAPVGYHEIDVEGRIVNVNKKELEMLGYDYGEMVGQFLWNFVLEEGTSRQNVLEKLAGIKPPGESFERIYKKKDGSPLPVLIKDSILRDQEWKIIGIRSTIQDITELKKKEQEISSLQEQLRQAQKMEAIGRLAGGIAHDFNNILSVIKGSAQLSLMDLREGDPLYSNLKEIERSADRASALTRQLLAFSRKQIMEMRVIDLNDLIRNFEKMLRRMLGEDIELLTYLSEPLGRVKADPGQIEQVIMNLVVNARDAMPRGGKLTIETANVGLDEEYARRHIGVRPGPYVMLSITDTGVGMTKEVQERIFEPFFTTKEMGRGTGLGLSTVYGIVKQSGGNIWVYSEPGKGTTFKIYLPRVEAEVSEVRREVEGEVPRGSETLLVIEDEETVRKLAVRLLKRQGYNVLEAPDGGKAFILCEKYRDPIHLILTDVVMPGMSGRELAERLKRIHPEARVLYMSGYTDNSIIHHGVLEEGIDFIQKPFTFENLLRKVREVLDK